MVDKRVSHLDLNCIGDLTRVKHRRLSKPRQSWGRVTHYEKKYIILKDVQCWRGSNLRIPVRGTNRAFSHDDTSAMLLLKQ